jgi:hypothetical protein
MTNKTHLRIIAMFLMFSALFTSCDKAENLLLSDSEILMKELKGSYTLVSVQHQDSASNNGGWSYGLSFDSTYSATGTLDMSSIDKAEFTGLLTIKYAGIDETHAINGNASAGFPSDKLWIITDDGSDIQAMYLYSPSSSYVEGWVDERSDSHILLRISETSVDYSGKKNRYFRFVK